MKGEDKLIKHLRHIGRRINRQHPEVNDGGCCVYASALGLALEMRGIKTSIIVASAYGGNLDQARPHVKDIADISKWNMQNIFFSHVGIELELRGRKYHHDTNGTKLQGDRLGEWRIIPGRLTVLEAYRLAENGGWNDTFCRREIPMLRNTIVHEMEMYDFVNREY